MAGVRGMSSHLSGRKSKAKSQKDRILAHLRRGCELTPMEAAERFDCWRLSARIYELRRDGWDIKDRAAVLYGKMTARYYLPKDKR